MEEIWKDIVGYEGLYQVSNLGNVKGLTKNKILTPEVSNKGYYHVKLSKKSKYKKYRCHRLVAFAFIPNIDNKPFINHINSVRLDNRVENLEWCTVRENAQHGAINNPKRSRTSKYLGVYFNKNKKTWDAKIHINKKSLLIGNYKTEIEAHEAYRSFVATNLP